MIHFADVATEAMMVCQPGFFDLSNRYEALDALGDDHNPNAQPNIDLIHDRFAALAKKWVPRPRNAK